MSMSFKNGSHLGAVRKIAIICLGCAPGHGDFSRQVEVVVADRNVIICKAQQIQGLLVRFSIQVTLIFYHCQGLTGSNSSEGGASTVNMGKEFSGIADNHH